MRFEKLKRKIDWLRWKRWYDNPKKNTSRFIDGVDLDELIDGMEEVE